jgi:hypothetical protein
MKRPCDNFGTDRVCQSWTFVRRLAPVALALLLASSASLPAATILVSADAHIDGVDVASNFGANPILSIEQTALGGNKAYLLFDASGWGVTNVGRVESLRVFWSASTGITRTLAFSLITGYEANDWTEMGITWENAPANNVQGTDRNFVAFPSQAVINLGSLQYSAGNPRELIFPIAEGSPAEMALLEALNTGDRKATIGVSYNSSQSTAVGLYSKEHEDGIYTPTLNVIPAVPPGIPVSFLLEPANRVVTTGPYKKVTFSAEADGSAPITYQWRTNGVAVDGAIGKTLALPAETTELNGTLVSVLIDNDATPDPGIVSSNALLTIVEPPTPDSIIHATADVYITGVANPTVYNAYTLPSPGGGQINYGLAATSGADITGPNRSYIGFTLGGQRVSKAVLKLYQYWGGPEYNYVGRLAQGTIRVFGSTNELTITEPPPQTAMAWPDNPEFGPPDNSNFVRITPDPDQVVGPEIGWYEFDFTDFYNANLGKDTVIRLGGVQMSGFDTPLFEDRENTAFYANAGGTWPDSGPRIELFLGPPHIGSVTASGNQLTLTGSAGQYASRTFHLLSSSNPALPLTGWTSIATNQFDATGAFSLSVPINPGQAAQFYILRVTAP